MVGLDHPDGTETNYRYDPFGRRIEKDVDGEITRYVYDGPDILLEFDGTSGPDVLAAVYYHGDRTDQPLAVERGGEPYFYHADHLGSIVAMSNENGDIVNVYEYDAYGQRLVADEEVANPYSYTGREFDAESDLYFYRARYYDPAIGRFLAEDPVGFEAGPNLYSYVGNNPLVFTDPDGLDIFPPPGAPPKFGRDKGWLPPGGPLSEWIEQNIPFAYTAACYHDALLDLLQKRYGLPDWATNYPTMPHAYKWAVRYELRQLLKGLFKGKDDGGDCAPRGCPPGL